MTTTLPKPKSDTADILYDLIKGKMVRERSYNYNSFRDIISRLHRIHGIPLRKVDVPMKTQHGEVRKYRKHFLLTIHRKKAIKIYQKINPK